MHNNKRSAARRIVRVDPADPINKQEKKKWITEQLNVINAALAECFYSQLFSVQWYPMIIFHNSRRMASHDYLKKKKMDLEPPHVALCLQPFLASEHAQVKEV